MDFTLKRKTKNQNHTLSLLYADNSKKINVLDVVEPPIAGLTSREVTKSTLCCGRYKLFLKPDKDLRDLIPVFQKERRGQRLGIYPVEEETPLWDLSFSPQSSLYTLAMVVGKIQGDRLTPNSEAYSKFMFQLIEATKHRETVWVTIE